MKSVYGSTHLFTLTFLSIVPLSLAAAECSAVSGSQTTPLLELYTSEGCSSCPPADGWLSHLRYQADKQAAGRATGTIKIVPLAFHVDYWDYIGWKDRFAQAQFSDRQRKTAAYGGSGFVYTPQFTLNGRDFRGWNDARLQQITAQITQQPARAKLGLHAITQANGTTLLTASAQAISAADIPHAQVFIALYENQLSSQVNAGENNGRELKHDYVVRELQGADTLNSDNNFNKSIQLPTLWNTRHGGAVIFVQDSRNGEVLQSLQLPFCNG